MSDSERERLRERVASDTATGDELDRLAGLLAQAIRSRELDPSARDLLLAELEALAERARRPRCTDALLEVRLDRQIRAFERRDASDAWAQLDDIRARWLSDPRTDAGEGEPQVDERLAAALFNTYRGGELLEDAAMRLAALEELRTRAHGDRAQGGSACRHALAELLADATALASRREHGEAAERAVAELRQLLAREPSLGLARELGRALRELARGRIQPANAIAAELDALIAAHEPAGADALVRRLGEVLVWAHAEALRGDEELEAERVRERLRGQAGLVHALGQALHDAAVLGLVGEGPSRALAELRALVHRHEGDELRAQLMSALYQVHRHAIEAEDVDTADRLQAEADALLESSPDVGAPLVLARLELRLDHLRMVLASHALAGDRGDWARAAQLLGRARHLVVDAGAPLVMVEALGQMLVNAHVDAGAQQRSHDAEAEAAARAEPVAPGELLTELRALARAHPHSAALQVHLATALFNAHVEASGRGSVEAGEALLTELDHLHRDHPGQLELRRRLVMALVNHHGERLEREELERASELLDRLRALVRSPDADDGLRIQLAMALGNTLAHVEDPDCPEDEARVVGELRMLAAREDASGPLRALILDELSGRFAPRQ